MPPRLAAVGPAPNDHSASVIADVRGVLLLTAQLRNLRAGEWTTQLTPAPGPAQPALHRLTLRASADALRVAVEANVLIITGGSPHLTRLADELDAYARDEKFGGPAFHYVLDWDSDPADESWIAADSLPLWVLAWAS
jgi:hypothetical protein